MTAVPKWAAGHLYLTGDLVQPLRVLSGVVSGLVNADFESGDTGWTKGTGWTIEASTAYAGSYAAKYQNAPHSNAFIEQASAIAITPGERVVASCMVNQGASDANDAGGSVWIRWYDASDTLLSGSQGTVVTSGSSGAWHQSTVSAVAPLGATQFRIAGECYLLGSGQALWLDQFALSYVPKAAPEGLVYKAVQDGPGTSANAEPVWPTTLGVQVIDNTVTWEAVYASRVTWEASPVLQSGTVEPTWPTEPGAFVSDGTISWECISRRVEDEKCPNSTVVEIIASKVFAVDGDIVRFSATANPRDWSSANDAGYIATGLQSANANDVLVLASYRGNLTTFNASSFQNWQVDPDPAAMANLDQMEGIGSIWNTAAQPVANDLFYLSQLGVRSIGVAASTDNLAAGDIGMPIDVLVRASMAAPPAQEGVVPISTYYPGAGQYWLAFRECGIPSISGTLPDGVIGDVVHYQYTITPAYPGQVVTLSVSGTLPPGLSIDDTGLVTGTLTTDGTYAFSITPSSDCGTGEPLADEAAVAGGHWWMTTSAVGHQASVWESDDLSAWGAEDTRSPNVATSYYGPVSLGIGVAMIGGSEATLERVTDFDPAGGIATTTITLAANIDRIRSFGDYAVALVGTTGTPSNTYYTTANKGALWTARTAPGTGKLIDVQRLDSGRWIALLSDGPSTRFLYSDDAGEPVNWTSATGGVASTGGGIACNGTAAAYLGTNNQLCRTTDGATWVNIANAPGATCSHGRDACAIGDVMLIAAEGVSSGYIRSTDAGLSFGELQVTAQVIQRFDVGNGLVAASYSTPNSPGAAPGIVSADTGAGFVDIVPPYTTGGSDYVRFGFVRYVP